MKKGIYILVIILLVLMTSCGSKSVTKVYIKPSDTYIYPITPGTPEWSSIGSYSELLKACQLPDEILKNISTEGLAETVANYPFYGNYMAYNTPQQGYLAILKEFNGLQELLKREDASIALLLLYQNRLIPEELDKLKSDAEMADYFLKLSFLELILLQNEVISDFEKAEIKTLISTSITRISEDTSTSHFNNTSAWLIIKALTAANYKPLIKEIDEGTQLKSFYLDGHPRSGKYIESIKKHAINFLK